MVFAIRAVELAMDYGPQRYPNRQLTLTGYLGRDGIAVMCSRFLWIVLCCRFIPVLAASPNFVVILTDDQSWVGTSYRCDPNVADSRSDYFDTPQMERLARSGMRFTDGYAPAPFCCPTRRSLQVGQTPAKHLYQRDQEAWPDRYRQFLSIPRMLKRANSNYVTAHFGKWDHRFDDVSPEIMGYDESDGLTGNGTGGGKGMGGPAAKEDPKLIFSLTQRACDFMERQVSARKPFYLQVSHFAVHLDIFYRQQTYQSMSSREKGKKHYLPGFGAMTKDLDTGIGILLDQIEALGIAGETYIFFMSDNGGRNALPGGGDPAVPRNAPLRDGKGSMYEGGLRVPFVVAGPGIREGSLSRVPVTGLDILPTLAELASYQSDLPVALDGGSFVPLLRQEGIGKVNRVRPYFIFHQAVTRKSQSAIRLGALKLVKHWASNRIELYDLEGDLGETRDIGNRYPKKRDELDRLLTDFLDSNDTEIRKTGAKK